LCHFELSVRRRSICRSKSYAMAPKDRRGPERGKRVVLDSSSNMGIRVVAAARQALKFRLIEEICS